MYSCLCRCDRAESWQDFLSAASISAWLVTISSPQHGARSGATSLHTSQRFWARMSEQGEASSRCPGGMSEAQVAHLTKSPFS